MEFKFDANQEYQIQGIEAAADLFEGQPRIEAVLTFALGTGFAAVANRLDLDEQELLKNLKAVQTRNGIPPDDALQCIEDTIETVAGPKAVRFANFSVEMETGTGKTYVYLRTALELFRRYGLRKFIVVVHSLAVREGVLKTLKVTERHFKELYANVPYHYYVYDSANLSQTRQFAMSDAVEIMVMTLDSFNKASNVIRQSTDRLQGETPVHLIQTARPVLILDEPQNMESEKSVAALALLDPLFALRYSATHRNPYNVVYRLTPCEAYRQGLVKRIEVASVVKEDDIAQPYLRLQEIKAKAKTNTARFAVHKLMKDGTVKERVITVRPDDSLQDKTGRTEYEGFEIDEINAGGGFVRFVNGVEIVVGQELGADKEAIFQAQIRYAIEEHLRKQSRLKDAQMKVLSLFFIDRVDNYRKEDGLIRRLFVRAFDEIKRKYPSWKHVDAKEVQAAYFAQRRTRSGKIIYEDSKTGGAERDREAYDLIMKHKERLLSFEEPVSFIFSHSALREGWDNPNIFQICTLNQTASEIKKRQEVGRGVRLAVNQSGGRVWDTRVNVLTVVANESYESFVAQLQSEIEEEYGEGILPPKPTDARKRSVARLRKEYTLRPEFKELWERVKQKTRYAVKIDTETFLDDVVSELNKEEVRPPRVTISKAEVQMGGEDIFRALQMSKAKTVLDLAGRYPLPNLVEIMAYLLEHTTPPVRLTRRTLLEIFRRAGNRKAAMDNPHEFATVAVQIIKRKLADQLVDGIRYERINDWYEMSQFDAEIESWQDYLVPSCRPDGSDGASVYDHVPIDSDIERKFVEGLEQRDDVKLYIKLPAWFTVPTPVGEYNPDWAIVMEERDPHGKPTGKPLLYLVRETKSTTNLDELRPDERRKIECGERHFRDALDVSYKVVTSADDLP